MTPRDALARLAALLEEERVALRMLDAAKVAALAEEKAAIVEALQDGRDQFDRPLTEALAPLVAELRRNCVLLAHARDVVRDAVEHARRGGPRLSARG